jgi:gliding motility associated protien GldN
MRTVKVFGCLLAALSLIVPFSLIAQEDNMMTESGQKIKSQPRDAIYKTNLGERMPLAHNHVEERDVLWEKRIWREIDVKELRNHHFSYEKRHFVSILFDAVIKGDITAYSAVDDEFTQIFSAKELNTTINRCDTIQITDEVTGMVRDVPVMDEFNPNAVTRFRIKEVTYFDSKLSRMNTRILGIAPIMNRYDNNGNFIASAPVCWFYYDELRPVLAKEAMFSSNSDTKNLTWDDVFESRIFASYITKESNVRDVRLQDVYSGVDILHESDKIKEGIRNYEADLFSEGN